MNDEQLEIEAQKFAANNTLVKDDIRLQHQNLVETYKIAFKRGWSLTANSTK